MIDLVYRLELDNLIEYSTGRRIVEQLDWWEVDRLFVMGSRLWDSSTVEVALCVPPKATEFRHATMLEF